MDREPRLDQISTRRSLFADLQLGDPSSAAHARQALVMRYNRAVRSYLGALIQNDADADDVAHEVVVGLLTGRFDNWNEARGRFRDYLGTAVYRDALAFFRKRKRQIPVSLAQLPADLIACNSRHDPRWLAEWVNDPLDNARRALRAYQVQTPGNVFLTVIELLADETLEDDAHLARELSKLTGREFTGVNARQQKGRARCKFAQFIVAEIEHTLTEPTPEAVHEELSTTGLLDYIQKYLPSDQEGLDSPEVQP